MRKTLLVLFVVVASVFTCGALAEEAAKPASDPVEPQAQQPEPSADEVKGADAASCAEPAADVADASHSAEAQGLTPVPVGEPCGGAICGKGTYCCNPSCSACVPLGFSCTQEACN